MTVGERIAAVLRGELPDCIPFTIYPKMLPRGSDERQLRQRGLGFAVRMDLVRWEYPNCQIERCRSCENGVEKETTFWRTPVGTLRSSCIIGGAYRSAWTVEYPVKSKDDYRAVEFLARDARPIPIHDEVCDLQRTYGDDGCVIGSLGCYSPFMDLVINLVGVNNFGYELADNPDPFWSVYESLCRKMRRAYPLVSDSPVRLVIYDGNIHPQVIGAPRFAKYILPCYEELAPYLHEHGKLLGIHLDADNRSFVRDVAVSSIDVIEAFTPPPDCDLSLTEARMAWPGRSSGAISPPPSTWPNPRSFTKRPSICCARSRRAIASSWASPRISPPTAGASAWEPSPTPWRKPGIRRSGER